jgi:hypothetical protein
VTPTVPADPQTTVRHDGRDMTVPVADMSTRMILLCFDRRGSPNIFFNGVVSSHRLRPHI